MANKKANKNPIKMLSAVTAVASAFSSGSKSKSAATIAREKKLKEIKNQQQGLKDKGLKNTAHNRKYLKERVKDESLQEYDKRLGSGTASNTAVKPVSSSSSKSKLAALNTQKRRDQYTARGWAQDATTKLKSPPAASKTQTPTPPTSKTPTIQGDGSKNVAKKPSYLGTINRGYSTGSLNVKDNKALVSNPVPTVGTPRQEQRKVKQAERKANRDAKRASRSLNRENKKATREATRETNQARKAVKKSLKNLGGTRKERIAQKNNNFEAGKPTVSKQSKISSVNRGLKPEPLTDFLSSSNSRDNKTFGVLQSDERTGGSESMRGVYFGSEKMQAAQRKWDADNPLSMESPVKMGQTMQGVAPVQNNPYQDVNQMNYNFDPLAQQRAQQMQMPTVNNSPFSITEKQKKNLPIAIQKAILAKEQKQQ